MDFFEGGDTSVGARSSATTLGEGHAIFSQLHQVHEESPAGGGSRLRGGRLGGRGQDGGHGTGDGGSFPHWLDRSRRIVGGCLGLEVEENLISSLSDRLNVWYLPW